MAEFKAIPLDMISAPNSYSVLPGGIWEVTSPNAQTLWFQLQIIDSLGARRYVAASGATITATFRRMDLISSLNGSINQTNRDVVKTAVFHANDRSLLSISMTSQDIQNIVSGGVLFSFTEGANTSKWIQDWLLKKKLTDPGF
ncbi:MAG: hypothetical protein QXL01_01340 [Thermoplasmatales archaeon]